MELHLEFQQQQQQNLDQILPGSLNYFSNKIKKTENFKMKNRNFEMKKNQTFSFSFPTPIPENKKLPKKNYYYDRISGIISSGCCLNHA